MLLSECGFSRLNEFRSLLSEVPFIALTATATTDTKETIFEVLAMRDPHLIVESPNKGNISYVVQYMKKNANLAQYFAWIAQEVPCTWHRGYQNNNLLSDH